MNGQGAVGEWYVPACIFSGGAKAHTVELEGLRLQSLVRSLRTTDCKRTPSNSAMCAFAPPEKMARFNVGNADNVDNVDNVDMICGMSGQ